MKAFGFLAVSLFLTGITGLAQAQTAVPTPTVAPGSAVTKGQIIARIKAQEARINADSKVGKLTATQTSTLMAALQTIRDKKNDDYAENGNKELTSDQANELNQMLNNSEASLTTTNGTVNYN